MSEVAAATDLQVAICGSAGDGTIAAGDILKRAMAKAGFKTIAFDLYPPEIRGFGKCLTRARFTSSHCYSLKHYSDVLISLDDSHAIPHVAEVAAYGAVIYEDNPIASLSEGDHISGYLDPSHIPYGVAFRELSERATSGAKSRNIVALGYLAGVFGMSREVFHETIAGKFAGKAAEITQSNLAAFDLGFLKAQGEVNLSFNHAGVPPVRRGNGRVSMMNGNAAVVRGCLDAEISTYFGYPITPATTIMEKLAKEMPKYGGEVLQTEDEISAAAATVGAGYCGSRAATATSGPGLALMTEVLGLASMAEVPSVFIVSQRGGPSTGMPTKTEQSDLNLAIYGAAGDAQRIVIAPTNVEGCYRCAGKAFEMAEQYQTPVIVLLDLYLSNRYEAVEMSDRIPFKLDCNKAVGKLARGATYQRFELTDDHVSPRALPGDEGCQHVITGLEHDEAGRPSDSPSGHAQMSHKRHAKLLAALNHPDFTHYRRFGDGGRVQVGLLGWGSSTGEILEAMISAQRLGIRCSAMKVVMLSPFPVDAVAEFMDDCEHVLVPELNHEGQFADLIGARMGRPVLRLTRATGTPLRVDEILAKVKELAGTEVIRDQLEVTS